MLIPRRKHMFLSLSVTVATCYLVVLLLLSACQSSFLYHPTHRADGELREWLIAGRHSGFVMRDGEAGRPVWLILHGNAGQASIRGYIADILPDKDAVYVLEYPGFGRRPGSPSMESINAAALEALRDLQARHPGQAVCAIGESMGSGPASWLGSQEAAPSRIVLVVPYNRLVDVAQESTPFLPVSLLLRDRWDNAAALKNYKGRLDIYVASEDRVIPVKHGRALRDALPQANYHELPGGHNDWSMHIGKLPE